MALSNAGQLLVLQITSRGCRSRPPSKPGDYSDALATWLNIISNQNRDPVSLIMDGVREGEKGRSPGSCPVPHVQGKALPLTTDHALSDLSLQHALLSEAGKAEGSHSGWSLGLFL